MVGEGGLSWPMKGLSGRIAASSGSSDAGMDSGVKDKKRHGLIVAGLTTDENNVKSRSKLL
jgi:hypothetical protein